MKKWLLIFGLFLLTGCTEKNLQPSEPNLPDKGAAPVEERTPTEETTPEVDIAIEDYFPKENKTYMFRGEGNEYATYSETFYNKTDSYLPSIVENGGTRLLRIYQLTNNSINLVYEQPEFYDEKIPSFNDLKSKFNPVPILQTPLKEGNSFNNWNITAIDAELDLPIGKLKNIIVLEQQDDENKSTVRSYWAPNFGKVKQEFISNESETEEFTVTSELKEIK
ncbi:hypothetical protein F7731_08830 [Cytobacillus depressus]|uniref:Lipoprotein n=1 Tax=Cytobacillus depressus TaxID=1602942 RepID=A0A6L3V8D4_9BACI|nr:hypothetical protein [Cytobacillus depressus]KAB2337687.1 hypothetical protein F7731_08830 [Cytobacillus depressus]